MQSYNLQRVSIPSSPEITYIRQFQEPSLYQALGILLLKLIARYRRNKIISNHMCETLKLMNKEIIEYLPSYAQYVSYFYELVDYILKFDNEQKALEDINRMIPADKFLQWISNATKAILLTLTKEKIYVKLDLENDRNFGNHNTTLFTSLMNKFGIAIKLYYFNQKYETFYPSKISVYPFMHILFNEAVNNNLAFNSYMEIYTEEFYRLESSNSISAQELESYPFLYSNGPTAGLRENDVTISASLLDNLLNEIIKANNEIPSHILTKITAITERNEAIATLPSLMSLRRHGNLVPVQTCDLCAEDKELKCFPKTKCNNCKVCIDCRLKSLNQCPLCHKIIDRDEKEMLRKIKMPIV